MERVVIARKGEGEEKMLGKVRILRKIKTEALKGLLVEMEPSEGIPKVYSHHGEEVRIVLEGEIEVYIRDKTYRLKEGDVMWFDSTTPHTVKNPGPEKAVFFVVGTGSSG
jgi:quercetin dioxygenase-like cupin family protein